VSGGYSAHCLLFSAFTGCIWSPLSRPCRHTYRIRFSVTPKSTLLERGGVRSDALKQHWSAFMWRYNHSESHHYINTPKVLDRCFADDWKMMSIKSRGLADVLKHSAIVERLGDLRLALRAHYELLSDVFTFYASMYGVDPLVLTRAGWDQFITDCKLVDGAGNKFFSKKEADLIFVRCNTGSSMPVSDDSTAHELPGHGCDVLVRFEFLEAIVRIATRKFVAAVECASLCLAIDRIVAEHVLLSTAWASWGGINIIKSDLFRR
jgi:hypothetical protein